MINCTSASLIYLLIIIKKIFNVIMIFVPILLILMICIRFINLVKDPDNKKEIGKIKNSVIAAVIIFFIPVIMNVVCNIIGTNTSFTSCWNSIDTKTNMNNAIYIDDGDQDSEYNLIMNSRDDYQSGDSKENITTDVSKYSNQAEALLSSLDKMSKEVQKETKNGIVWKYQNSNTRNTFNDAKESSRVCNCALLAVWGLVDIGVIDAGDRFYNKELPENTIVWSESTKNKILSKAELIDGNGVIAKKMVDNNTLLPGDIVFWYKTGHTNIYAGNYQFYEAGRVGTNGVGTMDDYRLTSFGPVGGGYIDYRVWKIIRLK